MGLPAPDLLFLGLCTEGVLFLLSSRFKGKVVGAATKGLAADGGPIWAESAGVLLWLECLLASPVGLDPPWG